MLGSNHLVSATHLAATLTTPPPPAASPFFARNRVILTSSGMNSNFDDEFFIDEIQDTHFGDELFKSPKATPCHDMPSAFPMDTQATID